LWGATAVERGIHKITGKNIRTVPGNWAGDKKRTMGRSITSFRPDGINNRGEIFGQRRTDGHTDLATTG